MIVTRDLASPMLPSYNHVVFKDCYSSRKQYGVLTWSSSEVVGSSLDVLVAGVVLCHQSFHNTVKIGHWNNRFHYIPDC